MLGTRTEDLEAFFLRAPLQNVDIDIAHAPAFHFELGRFVKVDRVRADEGRSIIVDDVLLPRTADSESRSEREPRPVRSRTHDVTSRQVRPERIFASTCFFVIVGGRADVTHAAEMRICSFDGGEWLVNN